MANGVTLYIPITDVDSFYGTGDNQYDSYRLYSSTTRGGTYSLVTTVALATGDTVYTYTDTSGTPTTWYKITFYNSVTTAETDIATTAPFPAARDILTRKELRQKVIRNLGGKILTPSAFAAQTVTVASLVDTGADSEYYKGWHVYRPDSATAADNDRRVSSYTIATGILTHGGSAYSDTTVGSEQIEILPLDIDYEVLNEKINDGLENTRWLYRFELGMTGGQNQYTLPHFIEGEEYVKEIWRRYGGTANAYVWRPVQSYGNWAKVRGSNFQTILDVDPSLGDNEVLALEAWRAGERLDSETDFTPVHQRWAEAAATLAVLDFLVDLEILRHDTTAYSALYNKWAVAVRKMARKHGPTPGMKLRTPFRMPGLPEV